MKPGAYFTLLFTALSCLLLATAELIMSRANQKEQERLQAQQQMLNQGILGPQAQQISAALLQSLGDAAVKDPEVRQLIEKHGYRVNQPQDAAAAPAVDKPAEEKKTDDKSAEVTE